MEEKVIVRVDPDLMELMPNFMESRRSDVLLLSQELNSHNYDTIRVIGHRMKGYGSSYGFHLISEIGAAIETAAEEEQSEIIRSQIDILGKYIEAVEIVIDE